MKSNQIKEGRVPCIGDVYSVCFDGDGSVQQGWRPAVVYQNNVGNLRSPNIVVLPITSSIKRVEMPTHVFVSEQCGLRCDSMVICENPCCISKAKLGGYITTLPDSVMRDIAKASLLASSAVSYLSLNDLIQTWQIATKLNRQAA